MKKKFSFTILATVVFGLPCFSQTTSQADIETYISKYKDLAIEEQVRSGVPAAITLAQGIVETSAGTSELCLNAHNHFGVKCKGNWKGETYLYDDDAKDECFRKYPNDTQSYRDHSNFLKNNSRYKGLFNLSPTDYADWAKGLKSCGYATNPQYAQKLIDYIQTYNLEQYTDQALENGVARNNQSVYSENKNASSLLASAKGQVPVTLVAYAAASPSNDTESATFSYYVTTHKNGLKGFYAKKGDMLLEYAVSHHIRYGRLLKMNDLPDAPLEANMFIYLEKKRKIGLQPYFKVEPGMDLLQVSQATGVTLEQIKLFNHLKNNEEPLPGSLIALQQVSESKVAVTTQNNTAGAFSNNASNSYSGKQESADQNESASSPYIYVHHDSQKVEKAQPESTTSNDNLTKTAYGQKENNANQSLTRIVVRPVNSQSGANDTIYTQQFSPATTQTSYNNNTTATNNNPQNINTQAAVTKIKTSDSQSSKVAPEAQKPLTPTEKLRAMMDKIVYDKESPAMIQEDTSTDLQNNNSAPSQITTPKSHVNPTQKLRSYMETLQQDSSEPSTTDDTQDTNQPSDTKTLSEKADRKSYTVRRGDTAFSIAKKFGITLKQLKEWNHLPASMQVHLGDKLIVAL